MGARARRRRKNRPSYGAYFFRDTIVFRLMDMVPMIAATGGQQ